MKYVNVFLILFLVITETYSQSMLTLEECLEYAFINNLDVDILENETIKNKLYLKQHNSSYLPSLFATFNHSYNSGRVLNYETYTWENKEIHQGSVSVTSELVVFEGFSRLYNRKILNLQLDLSKLNLEKNKLLIGLEIIRRYYGIQLIDTNIAIFDNVLTNTRKEISKLQERLNAGVVSRSFMFEMKAQEKKEIVSMLQLEKQLAHEYRNFANILNWNDTLCLKVSKFFYNRIDSLEILTTTVDFGPSNISSSFLLITERDLNLKLIEYMIKKQSSNYLPRISLNSNLSSRYLVNAVNHVNSGKEYPLSAQVRHNQNSQIGLTITIPFFDRMQNRSTIKIFEIDRDITRLAYCAEIQSLEKDIDSIRDNLLNMINIIFETRDMVRAYEESFNLAFEKYKAGQ